jgi:putative ABC transport system ATP-binding protein
MILSKPQPTSKSNHIPIVLVRNLAKLYQHGKIKVDALSGVNLNLPKGSFVVLYGPSGSGKSTLLHMLGGIDRPTQGEIYILDKALHSASETDLTRFRRDQVGFIFQFFNLIPSLNALDNTILPLLAKGHPLHEARKLGKLMLDQLGLAQRIQHRPSEMSGGEQQRTAIARALIIEPALVLADEPTGNLDSTTAHDIIQLMVQLNRETGITFIIATHNPVIKPYASHLFEMQDGRLSSIQESK